MSDAPDPLVPADVDLRGYEWMPLYGDRLVNSETWILASPEGKIAALTLWWNAFAHEVPAGSLPDNDRLLAAAAGYGVAIKAFQAIKNEALRGFVKCSDGRLHHPFLAERAIEAFETRRADLARKAAERERKRQKRLSDAARNDAERPPDARPVSAGPSAGLPRETGLKGQEMTGQKRSAGCGESPPAAAPAPWSLRFDAATYAAWIKPCAIVAERGVARIAAPSRLIADGLAGRYEHDLCACLGVRSVEVFVMEKASA